MSISSDVLCMNSCYCGKRNILTNYYRGSGNLSEFVL